MGNRFNDSVFVNKLKSINPNILVLGQYINQNTKIMVRCNKCKYEWTPTPKTLLRGIGCPVCSGRLPMVGKNDFATVHSELLKEWDYQKNSMLGILPTKITQKSGKKVWWICSICGHSWKTTPEKRVSGRGCPKCGLEKQKKERINTLVSKKGSLADNQKALLSEWDFESNSINGLYPTMITESSNKEAFWICSKCGYKWKAVISNRVKGSGCPVCANKIIITGVNDLSTSNPELLDEWDYEKNAEIGITPQSISKGSEQKVYWICKYCGHHWQAFVYSRTSGTACPECSKRWQSSIPEQALYYYLSKSFPKAINGFKSDWLMNSEIDIFIPELNLGIEYDGQAWHDKIEKDVSKDLLCQKHNIELLRVREPKCPKINNRKLTYIRLNKSLNSLDIMINDVIRMISEYYSIPIDVDVNFFRDKDDILKELNFHEIKNNISNIDGIKESWDYENNGLMKPEFFTKSSEFNAKWKCPNCGYKWESPIKNRLKNTKSCPVCSGKKTIKGINDFASLYPRLLLEWDYEKNNSNGVFPDRIPKSYRIPVHWICSKCGYEWTATPCNRVYGKTGCPKCWKQKRTHKIQQLDLNGNLIEEYVSAKEAAIVLGINKGCIQSVCNGTRNTYKGFVWKYKT